jgi:hypothetical protein
LEGAAFDRSERFNPLEPYRRRLPQVWVLAPVPAQS